MQRKKEKQCNKMATDLRTKCTATAATTGRIRDGKNQIVHNVSSSCGNESMHPKYQSTIARTDKNSKIEWMF